MPKSFLRCCILEKVNHTLFLKSWASIFVNSTWHLGEVCLYSCFDPRVYMMLTFCLWNNNYLLWKAKGNSSLPSHEEEFLSLEVTICAAPWATFWPECSWLGVHPGRWRDRAKEVLRPFRLNGKKSGLGSSLAFITNLFYGMLHGLACHPFAGPCQSSLYCSNISCICCRSEHITSYSTGQYWVNNFPGDRVVWSSLAHTLLVYITFLKKCLMCYLTRRNLFF